MRFKSAILTILAKPKEDTLSNVTLVIASGSVVRRNQAVYL